MDLLKKLKFQKHKNGFYEIKYGSRKLAHVDVSVWNSVILDYISSDETLSSLVSSYVNDTPETGKETKVEQFIRYYFTAKKAFYKRPTVVQSFKKNSKSYKDMAKAVAISESHGVTPQVFLKAQIEGLKFINAGAGIFPSPSQLVTPEAENRLLNFVNMNQHKVVLNEYDKTTPFKDNKKFMRIYKACQTGDYDSVTLTEVAYVVQVLEHKEREIPQFIVEARNHLVNGAQDE